MPSIEYLENKILLLENELSSLARTLERVEDTEMNYKKLESLLTFVVGYLLSPDNPPSNTAPAKEACRKMIRKWYYGGYRSKRVQLAAAELEKLTLSELTK